MVKAGDFAFAGKTIALRYDIDLWRAGETSADRSVITLRGWDERVFLHELLHVVAGPALEWRRAQSDWTSPDGTLADPEEQVVQRIEAALWDHGWRLSCP